MLGVGLLVILIGGGGIFGFIGLGMGVFRFGGLVLVDSGIMVLFEFCIVNLIFWFVR